MRRKDWHIPSSPVALPSCNYTAPAANQRPPAYSPSPQRPHLGQRDLSPSPHPMTRHHLTSISPSSLPPSHHGLTSPIFPPPPHHHPPPTHPPALSDALQAALKATARPLYPAISLTYAVGVGPVHAKQPAETPRPPIWFRSVPVAPAWIQGLLGKLIRQPAVSPTLPILPARASAQPPCERVSRRPSSHLDLHHHRLVISGCYCRRRRHGGYTQPLVLLGLYSLRRARMVTDGSSFGETTAAEIDLHGLHCGNPICPAWSLAGR